MRIALLGTYPLRPFQSQLGIADPPPHASSWNVSLARALAHVPGNEVHFITMHPTIPADRRLDHDGVTLHFLSAVPKARFATLLQYSRHRIVGRLRQIKPDIVHGHGTEHEYAYVASVAAIPWVITVHNYVRHLIRVLGVGRFGKRLILRGFERRVLRKAPDIICSTSHLADMIREETAARLHSIPNIVDDRFFAVEPGPVQETPVLLFVGYFRPEKNLDGLIRAFARVSERLPTARLDLIGEPTKDDLGFYRSLRADVTRLGLDPQVRFRGYLPPEQVAREMAFASAVVLPSHSEPFGLVLAEAMAVGTPVVATAVGGVRFVVHDRVTGFLVRPGDEDDLVEKLSIMLDDEVQRRKMGEAAREHAAAQFGPESVVHKTMDVYECALR